MSTPTPIDHLPFFQAIEQFETLQAPLEISEEERALNEKSKLVAQELKSLARLAFELRLEPGIIASNLTEKSLFFPLEEFRLQHLAKLESKIQDYESLLKGYEAYRLADPTDRENMDKFKELIPLEKQQVAWPAFAANKVRKDPSLVLLALAEHIEAKLDQKIAECETQYEKLHGDFLALLTQFETLLGFENGNSCQSYSQIYKYLKLPKAHQACLHQTFQFDPKLVQELNRDSCQQVAVLSGLKNHLTRERVLFIYFSILQAETERALALESIETIILLTLFDRYCDAIDENQKSLEDNKKNQLKFEVARRLGVLGVVFDSNSINYSSDAFDQLDTLRLMALEAKESDLLQSFVSEVDEIVESLEKYLRDEKTIYFDPEYGLFGFAKYLSAKDGDADPIVDLSVRDERVLDYQMMGIDSVTSSIEKVEEELFKRVEEGFKTIDIDKEILSTLYPLRGHRESNRFKPEVVTYSVPSEDYVMVDLPATVARQLFEHVQKQDQLENELFALYLDSIDRMIGVADEVSSFNSLGIRLNLSNRGFAPFDFSKMISKFQAVLQDKKDELEKLKIQLEDAKESKELSFEDTCQYLDPIGKKVYTFLYHPSDGLLSSSFGFLIDIISNNEVEPNLIVSLIKLFEDLESLFRGNDTRVANQLARCKNDLKVATSKMFVPQLDPVGQDYLKLSDEFFSGKNIYRIKYYQNVGEGSYEEFYIFMKRSVEVIDQRHKYWSKYRNICVLARGLCDADFRGENEAVINHLLNLSNNVRKVFAALENNIAELLNSSQSQLEAHVQSQSAFSEEASKLVYEIVRLRGIFKNTIKVSGSEAIELNELEEKEERLRDLLENRDRLDNAFKESVNCLQQDLAEIQDIQKNSPLGSFFEGDENKLKVWKKIFELERQVAPGLSLSMNELDNDRLDSGQLGLVQASLKKTLDAIIEIPLEEELDLHLIENIFLQFFEYGYSVHDFSDEGAKYLLVHAYNQIKAALKVQNRLDQLDSQIVVCSNEINKAKEHLRLRDLELEIARLEKRSNEEIHSKEIAQKLATINKQIKTEQTTLRLVLVKGKAQTAIEAGLTNLIMEKHKLENDLHILRANADQETLGKLESIQMALNALKQEKERYLNARAMDQNEIQNPEFVEAHKELHEKSERLKSLKSQRDRTLDFINLRAFKVAFALFGYDFSKFYEYRIGHSRKRLVPIERQQTALVEQVVQVAVDHKEDVKFDDVVSLEAFAEWTSSTNNE